MSVAMAEKCRSGETFGKGISHHVVSGTVDDLDNAVGDAFTKGHDPKVDVSRSRVYGILRQEAACTVVFQE